MLNKKKVLTTLLTLLMFEFSFLIFAPQQAIAKADDLVIGYNGSVDLVITNNSVLGVSTSTPAATNTPSTTAPSTPAPAPVKTTAPAPSASPKVVPVVTPAPNTSTTVKIAPTTTNNKLNVTIQTTTETKTPTPAPSVSPSKTPGLPSSSTTPASVSTPSPSPSASPNVQTTQKSVDNVVLKGANQQPVLTISADQNQNSEVKIQQQNVSVTTNLPIQIDTKTHQVSVETSSGTQNVSVLPDQAVKGADEKINLNLPTVKSSVSLTTQDSQSVYVVSEDKTGKLFGVLNVTIPSQVTISAQTGKTVSVWESPIGILGFLMK